MLTEMTAGAWPVPPPFRWSGLLSQWRFEPSVVVAVGLAAGLYAWGVVRLRRRGVPWPSGRVVAWAAGLLLVLVSVVSVLGVYDRVLFSVPAVQHMLLQMIAPVLLVAAAPITLALRTLPRRPRRVLLAVTHSAPLRVVGHPGVAFAIFAVTQFVWYYTPVYEVTLRYGWAHALGHLHFVLVGFLFYWSLLAVDPVPHRPGWAIKFLLVVGLAPMHILLGIPIMMSDRLFAADYYQELGRTWGMSLVSDQRLGGAVLWGFGDLASLVLIVVFLRQWSQSDDREARRLDRQLDRIHGDAATVTPWWLTSQHREPDSWASRRTHQVTNLPHPDREPGDR